jgi:hypothetical protein
MADVYQNGMQDLVVLNPNSSAISMLAGKGDGSFEASQNFALSGKPLAYAIGDLNKDDKPDLVVTFSTQTTLMVYLGSSPGQFIPMKAIKILGDASKFSPEAQSIALGDMNGDGSVDVVTGNSAADSVSVFLNDGTGQFSAPLVSEVGNYPRFVHVPDVNRDGIADLVFLSSADPSSPDDSGEPRVIRWFGKGDGAFDEDTHKRYATGKGPEGMIMADVSGNGSLDAITVHPADNSLYLLTGGKNGVFASGTRLYIGYRPAAVTAADLNRDGRADLAATLNAGSVVTRFSRGDMKFEDPNNFILSKGMKESLIADLNGDALPDLVVVNAANNDIGVLLGRTP